MSKQSSILFKTAKNNVSHVVVMDNKNIIEDSIALSAEWHLGEVQSLFQNQIDDNCTGSPTNKQGAEEIFGGTVNTSL